MGNTNFLYSAYPVAMILPKHRSFIKTGCNGPLLCADAVLTVCPSPPVGLDKNKQTIRVHYENSFR